jgi:hypothetical protein
MPIIYQPSKLREAAKPREKFNSAIAIFNQDPERYRKEHRARVIEEQKAMKQKAVVFSPPDIDLLQS